MDSDAIKRFFERLLHSSYMIDILNLLRITPITEEQIALLLHFSHFLPIISMIMHLSEQSSQH